MRAAFFISTICLTTYAAALAAQKPAAHHAAAKPAAPAADPAAGLKPSDVAGTWTNSGTFTAGSGTLNCRGNWNNGGTFNAGTGTVQLAATGAQTVIGNATFYNLSVSAAAPRVPLEQMRGRFLPELLKTAEMISTALERQRRPAPPVAISAIPAS